MVFLVLLWLAMFIAMTVLLVLIVTTLIDGASRLDLRLFTEYPSSSPARAGARPAILGSIWVIATTAVLAIPLGVAAAVQLEEFADKTKRVNHADRAQCPEPRRPSRRWFTACWRWRC